MEERLAILFGFTVDQIKNVILREKSYTATILKLKANSGIKAGKADILHVLLKYNNEELLEYSKKVQKKSK